MSVTAPQGFSAAGVAAGLKSSGDPDVAVVLNHGPDDAAAAASVPGVSGAEQVARMPRLIGTSVGVKLTLTGLPAACERFCTISGVCRCTPPTP